MRINTAAKDSLNSEKINLHDLIHKDWMLSEIKKNSIKEIMRKILWSRMVNLS